MSFMAPRSQATHQVGTQCLDPRDCPARPALKPRTRQLTVTCQNTWSSRFELSRGALENQASSLKTGDGIKPPMVRRHLSFPSHCPFQEPPGLEAKIRGKAHNSSCLHSNLLLINCCQKTRLLRLPRWLKQSACSAGDTGDIVSIPQSGRLPGEGNGNRLQDSCLKNSMDRGTWRATVQRLQSQTQLSMHTNKRSGCKPLQASVSSSANQG